MFGFYRISVYSGFGLDRYHCTSLSTIFQLYFVYCMYYFVKKNIQKLIQTHNISDDRL